MMMKMKNDVRKKEKKKKWSVKNSYTKEKEASSKLLSDERNSRIKSKKESLSASNNPGLSNILNQTDWSTCRLIFVAFQAYVTVNLSFFLLFFSFFFFLFSFFLFFSRQFSFSLSIFIFFPIFQECVPNDSVLLPAPYKAIYCGSVRNLINYHHWKSLKLGVA